MVTTNRHALTCSSRMLLWSGTTDVRGRARVRRATCNCGGPEVSTGFLDEAEQLALMEETKLLLEIEIAKDSARGV